MITARGRRIAAWLFALALLVRVAVPQGYMLSRADDGVIRISLCSGTGAMEMGIDRDGRLVALDGSTEREGDGHPGDKPKPECPFAAALSPTLPATPDALPERPRPTPAAPLVMAGGLLPGRGLAAPPPPSTGPPPRA